MYSDQRNKGLAVYRAARARRKEIAIIASKVYDSDPGRPKNECKKIAEEIYEVGQNAEAERTIEIKNKKSKHTVEVLTVNRID